MNSHLVLSNKVLITENAKKTTSQLFRNLKLGDEIEFRYNFVSTALAGLAPRIYVENSFKETIFNTPAQLKKNLSNFSFVPELTAKRLLENSTVNEVFYKENRITPLSLEFALYGEFSVTKVLKKTSAQFFSELTEDDVFVLELPMNTHGVSKVNFYMNEKMIHSEYPSKIQRSLNCFEFNQLR